MKRFVCFGEVLWDIFPEAEKIGGAPLNVALRLSSFPNNHVHMISAIGNDSYGKRLIKFLKKKAFPVEGIQVHSEQETGKVLVKLDSNGIASYTIKKPVAWDHIDHDIIEPAILDQMDVLIYGSLACRNSLSRHTLEALLRTEAFKVFDVNLRPPYFSLNLINSLMRKSDFIKLNDEELEMVIAGPVSMKEAVLALSEKTGARGICITRGSEGAMLYWNHLFYEHPGFKVDVKDTVGAGDSFLATLIHNLIHGRNPEIALEQACAVGALVASHEGANPILSASEIEEFISNS